MSEPARKAHTVVYVNHRGETAERKIHPIEVWHGSTEWHTVEQWLLRCFDVERNALRNYALASVLAWNSPPGELPLGLYRHFKGGLYLAVGIVYNSELPAPMEEPLIRYRKLEEDFSEWVRPVSSFCELVPLNGSQIPRFVFVSSKEGDGHSVPIA